MPTTTPPPIPDGFQRIRDLANDDFIDIGTMSTIMDEMRGARFSPQVPDTIQSPSVQFVTSSVGFDPVTGMFIPDDSPEVVRGEPVFNWASLDRIQDQVNAFKVDYANVKALFNKRENFSRHRHEVFLYTMTSRRTRREENTPPPIENVTVQENYTIDLFFNYFRENYALGSAIISAIGLRSRFARALLATRSPKTLESDNAERIIDTIKKSKTAYNIQKFKVGSVVMVRPGKSGAGRVYEVVGFRDGRGEVMLSPLGYERRGNVRRYSSRDIFWVGSSWPIDEEVEPIEAKSFQFIKDKETKEKFYQQYQIGVEIEGEFFFSPDNINSLTEGYFNDGNIVHDGSIYPQNDGYLYEINSPLLDTALAEHRFLENMSRISRDSNEKSPFATRNNTAGTHVHFDINRMFSAEFYMKYGLPEDRNIPVSQYLRFLDSVEFEKFFFREYFRHFKMKKFWGRLSNNYCRAFLKRMGLVAVDEGTKAEDVESIKMTQGKYKWLNFKSLERRMGIEFRIFPYLTTARGIKNVVEFTEWVVMSYMDKYATHDKLMVIHDVLAEAAAKKTSGMGFDSRFPAKDRKVLVNFFKNDWIDVRNCSYDGMVLYNSIKKKLELEKKKHV